MRQRRRPVGVHQSWNAGPRQNCQPLSRWAPLDALWDERWFLRCRDPALQRRRLVLRHLETWSDEKAARWGAGEEGAAKRADANDVLNMELIAPCEEYAERVIDSMDSSEA